jgi:septal ring factor EnvC (AmiA/AmiB activator)
MKPVKKSQKLANQLEDRKKNLAVVEETIKTDPRSEEILDPVKTFLSHRIESIELELTRN